MCHSSGQFSLCKIALTEMPTTSQRHQHLRQRTKQSFPNRHLLKNNYLGITPFALFPHLLRYLNAKPPKPQVSSSHFSHTVEVTAQTDETENYWQNQESAPGTVHYHIMVHNTILFQSHKPHTCTLTQLQEWVLSKVFPLLLYNSLELNIRKSFTRH